MNIPTVIEKFVVKEYISNYYKDCSGLIIAENKNEFESNIQLLLKDKNYYQSMKEAQRKKSGYWFNNNTDSSKRIIGVIEKTINEKEQYI